MFDPLSGFELNRKLFYASCYLTNASVSYGMGLMRYMNEFLDPFWISLTSFNSLENRKVKEHPLPETLEDYMELLQFNLDVARRGYESSVRQMEEYHGKHFPDFLNALERTFTREEGEDIEEYAKRLSVLMNQLACEYPLMIKAIRPFYGFHFDSGCYELACETPGFLCYRVLPTAPGVTTNFGGKPVLVIPPYVLGANILCFLPGENKSYVHAYANQGVPVYIRIMKDIAVTEAVQKFTGEDDALQTRAICEHLKNTHGKMVTVNGFCQGGFIAVLDILSDALDGLVDALITCVSPMDGTRSRALVEYLEHLPQRFRDLGYAVKDLPNGNRIVDGKVMGWVYKLKSMDREAPLVTFYRDLMMIETSKMQISNTAAALNYWLIYDRADLPEAITRLSFKSYTVPITADGTLPVKLFGRSLNFKALTEKNVRVLICVAAADDLVDSAAALAPLDYIEAEVTRFPKGHGAIATSWSNPKSECALHTEFNGQRGPVKFHLDLDAALDLDAGLKKVASSRKRKGAVRAAR